MIALELPLTFSKTVFNKIKVVKGHGLERTYIFKASGGNDFSSRMEIKERYNTILDKST